jgi:hypothetical protein
VSLYVLPPNFFVFYAVRAVSRESSRLILQEFLVEVFIKCIHIFIWLSVWSDGPTFVTGLCFILHPSKPTLISVKLRYAGLQVLIAVVLKTSMFWDMTPCSPLKVNRRFGEICRLHLQSRSTSQARNQHLSRWLNNCVGSGLLLFKKDRNFIVCLYGYARRTASLTHAELQTSTQFNWREVETRGGGRSLLAWSATSRRGDKVTSALQRFNAFPDSYRQGAEGALLEFHDSHKKKLLLISLQNIITKNIYMQELRFSKRWL